MVWVPLIRKGVLRGGSLEKSLTSWGISRYPILVGIAWPKISMIYLLGGGGGQFCETTFCGYIV